MSKTEAMLTALVHSAGPISGEDLGAQLGVSSRTVRSYVRAVNRRTPLITATHRGYVIDRELHRESSAPIRVVPESPAARLQFICRYLAEHSEPTSVHDLASMLCISESTLDSDLTRARDALRHHDLVLRRDHSMIWAEGLERSRRSLVRQLFKEPAGGFISSTWAAFCAEYEHYAVKDLRHQIAALVDVSELEFHEYALTDVVMHLVVTMERVRQGGVLPAGDVLPSGRDPQVLALRDAIGALVEKRYAVTLPPTESDALYQVLTVRGAEPASADAVIDPTVYAAVSELMDEIADQYLLGPSDPALLRSLALHVQNLIARPRTGATLLHPFGEDFKNAHPLVHDLAVCFASKVEARLGIEVDPCELAFLSFHLGLQYMRCLEERDLVTVTLVVPRYYDLAERVVSNISDTLRGQAVIEEVSTCLEFDFTAVTSDLIVSCIDPHGSASAPIIVISPFVTPRDTENLLTGVRRVRERNSRRRARTALATLIDPRAFFHGEEVESQDAAIGMMIDALVERGYVEPAFHRDVLDREGRSSTHFGGEFAIPHSMHVDAKQTGIAVLVSETGIPWGGSRVHLVFLVALSPNGCGAFRDVLEVITRLLGSRAAVASLVAGSNGFDEFMDSLSALIDGEFGAACGDLALAANR